MTVAPVPSSEVAQRFAAIDVGTNSIRLVVAEVAPDGSIRIIDDEKVLSRLGRGLSRTGRLDDETMESVALSIAHLKTIADGCDVHTLRAVATFAVREAANGDAFVELVRERAGIDLEVLTAEEEARLAYLSVRKAFDLRSTDVATVDVGGGSTEVVIASGEIVERICTLDFGAVVLTEAYGLGGSSVPEKGFRAMRRRIRRTLEDEVGSVPVRPQIVIGTGGTFTNLAAMSMHRGENGSSDHVLPYAVRGYELQRSEVKHLLERLRKMPLRDRVRTPGLNPDRADIIVAGLAIVDGLLKHLGVNRLRVHDGGIRSGLIHEMAEHRNPEGAGPSDVHVDRMRTVERFAVNCRHDHRHAVHVSKLAVRIFDELASELDEPGDWVGPEARSLLHVGSLLHDVGYLINYSKHHKHSYHLVMHSGLAGFTHRELSLVANIARYHRGASPKEKHGNFRKLDPGDRDLVRRLAAILRLAVGLDRSHTQRVEDVRVTCEDGIAFIEVLAAVNPCVEIWGAERKSRLFEKIFGLKTRIRWIDSAEAAS